MFALGWILFLTIIFVVSGLLQILLYAISFKFLLRNKLEDFFEEIDTKKLTLTSLLIVYLLPIPISFVLSPIYTAIGINSYGRFSLFFSLSPHIICFVILFHYFWKRFILINQEDIITKVIIISYLVFLPFALIALLIILAYASFWGFLFLSV